MNKLYIGNTEVANVQNPSDFVDVSTWNAHEKVIATALVNLKAHDSMIDSSYGTIDASLKSFDASIKELAASGGGGSFDPTYINSSISDLSTRISTIESDYLVADDISVFYTKSHIDASYGVVDASLKSFNASIKNNQNNIDDLIVAFREINESVSYLDASALAFDASIKELATADSFDPTDINSSISDLSTRISTIESDYLVADDISVFYTKSHIDASFGAHDASIKRLDASAEDFRYDLVQMIYLVEDLDSSSRAFDASIKSLVASNDNYYNKNHIDTSYGIIDASLKNLDASIKELSASGSGGGSFDPTDINSSISDISTRVHNIESNYLVADDISIYYTKSHIDASFGDVDYALDNISDDIENLDTNKADKTEVDTSINSLNTRIVDVSSYAQDVSARMPIFEYNSATQTLNIIA